MAVETKCNAHTIFPHSLETHAVHKTQFLSRGCQDCFHAGAVAVFRDPIYLKQRQNIFRKGPDGRNAKPMLQQRANLEEHMLLVSSLACSRSRRTQVSFALSWLESS